MSLLAIDAPPSTYFTDFTELQDPQELPDGPRERALEEGIAALGDADLLAVLLGTGLAGRPVMLVAAALLEGSAGLSGLARLSPAAIAEHPGIGLAKALRVTAALELGKRAALRPLRRPRLCNSQAVFDFLTPTLATLPHEEMWVLCLDGRNNLRARRRVGQGGLHACSVSARDVMRIALAEAASTILVAHNHPSGDAMPSSADVQLTRQIAAAGDVVGIPLLDHVILTPAGPHVSLLDLGVLAHR